MKKPAPDWLVNLGAAILITAIMLSFFYACFKSGIVGP